MEDGSFDQYEEFLAKTLELVHSAILKEFVIVPHPYWYL